MRERNAGAPIVPHSTACSFVGPPYSLAVAGPSIDPALRQRSTAGHSPVARTRPGRRARSLKFQRSCSRAKPRSTSTPGDTPGMCRYCCKNILSILSRDIDSRSGANAQQRFKGARAPIRSLKISNSRSLLGDFCNNICQKRTCIPRRSAGPFKQTVVAPRQSKVDWRAAAQSREALRSSSRQRLALMAWRLCRSHRRR
jgi:hypothetical protein